MKFNERLLEGLNEDDRPLGSIILFFIERGYNLYHYFQIKDGKMILSDHLYNDVQRLTTHFLKNEVLIPDYPNESIVRLSNTEHLYVSEETTGSFDIDRMRKFFPAGKKADKKTCIRLLTKWFQDHPDKTMEDVEVATKAYIDNCRLTGRYVRDADNFIFDTEETSMLSAWIEESSSNTNTDWRTKLV